MAQVKTPCVFYDFFSLPALLQALSKLLLTRVLTLVPQLCLSLPVMALQWRLSRCVSVLSMLCWAWPYRLGLSTQPLAQLTVSCNTNFILCMYPGAFASAVPSAWVFLLPTSPSHLIGLIMASSGLLSCTSFPYCPFHVLAVCCEHSPSCFRVV